MEELDKLYGPYRLICSSSRHTQKAAKLVKNHCRDEKDPSDWLFKRAIGVDGRAPQRKLMVRWCL